MKQKIRYGFFNSGALILTIILWVVIITCFVLYLVLANKDTDRVLFWSCIGVTIFTVCWSLIVVPVSVSVDDENVNVHKFLRTKRYKIKDISSVKPTQITSADIRKNRRIFRWPRYYSGGDGEYYAYYGSPNNPVLITFKNGKRLIIGSSDQNELVEAINSRM